MTVKGTGFKANKAKDQVYIVECLFKTKGAAQCDIATTPPVTITATGVLPATKFKVATIKIGSGYCGTKPVNLKNCAVSVDNASGFDSAVVQIIFAFLKKVK